MCFKNTKQTYGVVAKIFHWLIALMIFCLLAVGFIMSDMENTPDKFRLYGLHKSFGITVLILAAARLLWKLLNVAPELPESLAPLEKLLAKLGHAGLYVLMFAMPLSGWLMSSAAGFPVSVFGLFTLPNLIEPMGEQKEFFEEVHETIGWIIIVVVGLHVLAALLHHFYYRNNVLRRMMPFMKTGEEK